MPLPRPAFRILDPDHRKDCGKAGNATRVAVGLCRDGGRDRGRGRNGGRAHRGLRTLPLPLMLMLPLPYPRPPYTSVIPNNAKDPLGQ